MREHENSATEASIPIEYICEQVLEGSTLDIFILIASKKDREQKPSRIDLIRMVQRELEGKVTKNHVHATMVGNALTRLEAACFIKATKDSQALRYHLTPYGEIAAEIVQDMIRENPFLLHTTRIALKNYKGNV